MAFDLGDMLPGLVAGCAIWTLADEPQAAVSAALAAVAIVAATAWTVRHAQHRGREEEVTIDGTWQRPMAGGLVGAIVLGILLVMIVSMFARQGKAHLALALMLTMEIIVARIFRWTCARSGAGVVFHHASPAMYLLGWRPDPHTRGGHVMNLYRKSKTPGSTIARRVCCGQYVEAGTAKRTREPSPILAPDRT